MGTKASNYKVRVVCLISNTSSVKRLDATRLVQQRIHPSSSAQLHLLYSKLQCVWCFLYRTVNIPTSLSRKPAVYIAVGLTVLTNV